MRRRKADVIGAPAHLLTLYMIPLFQLDEKKKLIDITTVIMTVVNVSLNILFVVENMGIKGIGYSTSISYYVALMILGTHFLEKKNGILLRGKFSIDLRYLIETVKEGAPSAFKNISSIIFNTFVCYYLAYFQAIGKNRIVYSISVVLNIVTLPRFYLLGIVFGARGIWISFSLQFVIVASYVIIAALIMGRKNKSNVDKLLVMPVEEGMDYETYDFHIGSNEDAKTASTEFGDICKNGIAEKRIRGQK